ncbi:hypothetical protein M153_3050000334 [Pseudoloma neurophilia]|uniref:Uncharacterized protein n=1 Tax=Pseudoloma neurophilia TaxID=146866 RepID=A0A0R0LTH8_9MICR|nr:hypothetical protein M153_3050000334 [Pseudoloma neurophilia]
MNILCYICHRFVKKTRTRSNFHPKLSNPQNNLKQSNRSIYLQY